MGKRYATFAEYLKNEYKGPYVATDIIIRFDDGKKNGIVLIERKEEPHGLALPGGIAERMTLEENAVKEALEETGLAVTLDTPHRPLCVFSGVGRDPRAHIMSVAYTASGVGVLKPQEDEDAKNATLFTLAEVSRMLRRRELWAFNNHRKILEVYLEHMRYARDE